MKDTYLYEITESEEIIEETGRLKTYGIMICHSNREFANQKNEYCRIDNISPDYNKIVDLKNLIERLELYPIHLPDVIEDFLS